MLDVMYSLEIVDNVSLSGPADSSDSRSCKRQLSERRYSPKAMRRLDFEEASSKQLTQQAQSQPQGEVSPSQPDAAALLSQHGHACDVVATFTLVRAGTAADSKQEGGKAEAVVGVEGAAGAARSAAAGPSGVVTSSSSVAREWRYRCWGGKPNAQQHAAPAGEASSDGCADDLESERHLQTHILMHFM